MLVYNNCNIIDLIDTKITNGENIYKTLNNWHVFESGRSCSIYLKNAYYNKCIVLSGLINNQKKQ